MSADLVPSRCFSFRVLRGNLVEFFVLSTAVQRIIFVMSLSLYSIKRVHFSST